MSFEQFTTHCLSPEETADEFLTDLLRLARLVWKMPPECWIKSAFVNGLPSYIRGLRLSARLETLTLKEVLKRACAVLVDTRNEHLAAVARPEQTSHTPEHSQKCIEGCHLFQMRGPEPTGQRLYSAQQC